MDPHVKTFEVLEETDAHVVVRTGFEAVIRKQFADPMPAFLRFDTDTLEKLQRFQFDDPWDERRYFRPGDNQIAGVGGWVCAKLTCVGGDCKISPSRHFLSMAAYVKGRRRYGGSSGRRMSCSG